MKKTTNSRTSCSRLCFALFLTILMFSNSKTFAQCVSPPARIGLLANEAYMLTADAGLTNYQWFRDTGSGAVAIVGANTQTYEVTQYGRYTWTANTSGTCPTSSCCVNEFVNACNINIISAIPSACDKWSNTYDVAVRVTYNMAVMADLLINGQRFTPAGLSGTQTFSIGRFNSNGASNITITASISNSGTCSDTHTYNAPSTCQYKDPISPSSTDPIGYIYCEQTGQIITGGTISVTPPAGGVVTVIENGSTGRYSWLTNGVVGVYSMTYTPPAGYVLSSGCMPQPGVLDPTGFPDPYFLGSNRTGMILNDYSCAGNPYFMSFNLAIGDPIIDQNNIPLRCPCPSVTASITPVTCNGNIANTDAKITLSNLVNATHFGYSVGSIYTGPAYAAASTIPPNGEIVTGLANPIVPTNYTVRVFNSNFCYTDYTLTLQARVCTCRPAVCLEMTSVRVK